MALFAHTPTRLLEPVWLPFWLVINKQIRSLASLWLFNTTSRIETETKRETSGWPAWFPEAQSWKLLEAPDEAPIVLHLSTKRVTLAQSKSRSLVVEGKLLPGLIVLFLS